MNNKSIFTSIIIFLTMFFILGCSKDLTGSNGEQIIAVYDAPEILVSYEEIKDSYKIYADEDKISTKEIEDLFNLFNIIKKDVNLQNKYVFQTYSDFISLRRDEKGYIRFTMGQQDSPTAGSGNTLIFYHTSNNKYELINVTFYIS